MYFVNTELNVIQGYSIPTEIHVVSFCNFLLCKIR